MIVLSLKKQFARAGTLYIYSQKWDSDGDLILFPLCSRRRVLCPVSRIKDKTSHQRKSLSKHALSFFLR